MVEVHKVQVGRVPQHPVVQDQLPPALAKSKWRATPAERRKLRREQLYFGTVRRAEGRYSTALRKIGRHVGDIVRAFTPGDEDQLAELVRALEQYAQALNPWSRATAARMVSEVIRRDATAWFKTSREIGQSLRAEIETTPLGAEIRRILDEQVYLISSLPIEAGLRVQQLTREYVAGGRRYDDLVDMIRSAGNVTAARATLVARTETAKAASAVVQARARYVGADSYVWRTAHDANVRKMHKKLDGRVFRWDDPPIAETNGERHHPGEFPNCRCWAEPIIPEKIK